MIYGYIRVSTEKQTVKNQKMAIRAYCRQRRLHTITWIDETISGTKKPEKRKLGASTISQQTAKNVFLWPGRSWVRKGFEAYFTVLIELFWSKQRIMEVYLNSIEMGDGIYGADAVATDHFLTTAAGLSRSQCALIAATLPNPRRFSSKNPSSYMLRRQQRILHEMHFVKKFPREGEDSK